MCGGVYKLKHCSAARKDFHLRKQTGPGRHIISAGLNGIIAAMHDTETSQIKTCLKIEKQTKVTVHTVASQS